jgi:hypothetical protein
LLGQDAVATSSDAFVVVDAASPSNDENSMAARKFAGAVADSLLARMPRGPVEDAVAAVIDDVKHLHPKQEALTAAFACVWLESDVIRAAVLADCAVVCRLVDDRVEWICDERVAPFDSSVAQERERLRRDNAAPRDIKARLETLLDENRRRANVPDGYWVLSDNLDAARQVSTAAWPVRDVRDLLLCSDGYWRAIDPFAIAGSPAELVSESGRLGLEELVRRIRAHEADDPEMSRFPRVDPADDTTALMYSRLDGHDVT